MSRIDYVDVDSERQFLRACAFEANTKRHLKGKKGQAALKELEAALLALPEKKLVHSKFVVTAEDSETGNGAVCAMGAIALKRKMDRGLSREAALKAIDDEITFDPEDGGWPTVKSTAEYLGCVVNFAWEVIEMNDEHGGPTPGERYKRVLEWCREKIGPSST